MWGGAMRLNLKRPSGRDTQSGFSTLEAMVAIAILSIALLPLYSFQNTIVSGSARVEANLEAQAKHELAATYIHGLVPSGLSEGAARLGELDLRWSMEELHPARDVLSESGSPGRFELSLVRVTYTIGAAEDSARFTGSIDRVAWVETSSIFRSFDP